MAVFLDASYAIALSSARDQYHQRAVAISEKLEIDGTQLVTTRAVIIEIGNALSKQKYRDAAIELLTSLKEDPTVEIIPLSEELFERAFSFYQSRQDKEWGITDCISFVVMQERGLTEALTADEHFHQAGYRTLLKEF